MSDSKTLNALPEDDRDTPEGRFRSNPDVRTIEELLEALALGDQIEYEAINLAIGRDIRENKYALYAAVKRLLQRGLVYQAIPNVGYKRLTDSECVKSGNRDIEACRRRALRAAKKTRAGHPDALSQEDKVLRAVTLTQAVFVVKSASPDAAHKLETVIAKQGQTLQLTFQQTLDIFTQKKKKPKS